MSDFQSFAVIPAAGHSRRMKRPKLLLPWRDKPIIQHVISAWLKSHVSWVVIVVRKDDERLLEVCREMEGRVVLLQPAIDPVDMRRSVQLALERIQNDFSPKLSDAWMLAPADMPRLNQPLIDAVLDAYRPTDPAIVRPESDGCTGHPVLFPWSFAHEVSLLQANEGVNSIVKRNEIETVNVNVVNSSMFDDIDTACDYERLTTDD